MRMEIVAEGVETFEQVVHLREHGIHAAQGYVFAPPLPGKSYLQLLDAIEPIKTRAPARLADAATRASANPRLQRAAVRTLACTPIATFHAGRYDLCRPAHGRGGP